MTRCSDGPTRGSGGRTRAMLGGSFDPPHLGHLHLARSARHQLDLDEVRLLPAGLPPHKLERSRSAATHRRAMTELLADAEPWLSIDDRELAREGPSYTILSVLEIEAEHPEDPPPFFLLGSDLVDGLPGWHRAAELARRVRFAVAPRETSVSITPPEGFDLVVLDVDPWPVSSSEIRQRIAAGENLEGLLLPAVLDYARRHGLYSP